MSSVVIDFFGGVFLNCGGGGPSTVTDDFAVCIEPDDDDLEPSVKMFWSDPVGEDCLGTLLLGSG